MLTPRVRAPDRGPVLLHLRGPGPGARRQVRLRPGPQHQPHCSRSAACMGSNLNGMATLNACEQILKCVRPLLPGCADYRPHPSLQEAYPHYGWFTACYWAYQGQISLGALGFLGSPFGGAVRWRTGAHARRRRAGRGLGARRGGQRRAGRGLRLLCLRRSVRRGGAGRADWQLELPAGLRAHGRRGVSQRGHRRRAGAGGLRAGHGPLDDRVHRVGGPGALGPGPAGQPPQRLAAQLLRPMCGRRAAGVGGTSA